MSRKQFLMVALCLSLAIALIGCRITDSQASTAHTISSTTPSTTMPPETTVPAPTPEQIYLDGIRALGVEAVAMEIVCEQTMTLAGQTFHVDMVQAVSYWNMDTEELSVLASQSYDYGDHELTFIETFCEDTVYQEINHCYFQSKMDREAVLERYPGVQLLDPALYDLTLEDDTTILFENATGIEKWVVGEEGELITAQASVTLSAEGVITDCTYTVEYVYGPATYCEVYTVTYREPDIQAELPENLEKFKELDNIDGMWLLESAFGYIRQAKQYSTEKTSSIQSQISGLVLNRVYDLDVIPSAEGTNDYRLVTNVQLSDSRETVGIKNDERFIMGRYSSAVDDGKSTYNSAVTEVMMNSYCQNLMIEDLFEPEMLENASIFDLGSLLLVEYTCSEEMGGNICNSIYRELHGTARILSAYSTGYKTNHMTYYLSLDKYTLLPVALGYYYEGSHAYDGEELLTIEQVTQKYDLASLTAYEAVHDKPSADQKPDVMPTPLFYRVTGTEGQEMWLFGTIHVGDDRTGFLPKEIYDALDDSVGLVVECNTDSFERQLKRDKKLRERVSDCYYYEDGTIGDHLTTEGLHAYAAMIMKATGNYDHNAEYLKAGTWSSSIDNFYLSQGHRLSSEKGIERRLMTYAKENNIPIWEAESVFGQLEMLTGFSDELQEFQLYSSAYSHGRSSWEATEELYEMWLDGNEEALIREMERTPWGWSAEDFENMESYSEEEQARVQYILDNLDTINAQLGELQKEYTRAMEIDRNISMLHLATIYLESGDTVFYAVGLAHLLAEDGLVFALREAGYTVELVTFEDPA